MLIDKKDHVITGFVFTLLDALRGDIDIIRFFDSKLGFEEEYCVDLDMMLSSLITASKEELKRTSVIRKVIVPQLISITYSRLLTSVGKVDFYFVGHDTIERLHTEVIYDDLEDDVDIMEVKFLVEIVFAV